MVGNMAYIKVIIYIYPPLTMDISSLLYIYAAITGTALPGTSMYFEQGKWHVQVPRRMELLHPFYRPSVEPELQPERPAWLFDVLRNGQHCIMKFESICSIFGDGSKPWYLVNPKIAGKWMFIPLKNVSIGIDPYPFQKSANWVRSTIAKQMCTCRAMESNGDVD